MPERRDVSAAKRGVAVTKSDTTVIEATRSLYIGGAGDVAVVFADDPTTVTLSGATAGAVLPVSVVKVMSTNTTATLIVALY